MGRPAIDETGNRHGRPDENYEPGNCRWADWVTQANNKSLAKQGV